MMPARWAIRLVFGLIAFNIGLWTYRIGEFQKTLGIDHETLGFLLLAMPIVMTICFTQMPRIARKLGMIALIRIGILANFAAVLGLSMTQSLMGAFFLLGVFGATAAFFEVGMNAVAGKVDRDDRAVMSSCHGFWSLGFALGGLSAALLTEAAVSFQAQQIGMLIIGGVLLFWLSKDLPRPRAAHADSHGYALPDLKILPICLLPIAGLFLEGAIGDWNTLYLRGERGWSDLATGQAIFAFMGAMALSRFLGDALRMRYDVLVLFRSSTLFSIIGLALYAFAPNVPLVIIGAFLAGLGAGNVYPYALILGSEGRDEGESSHIIGAIALIAFNAFLIAPVYMGFAGERGSLAFAFAGILPLFLLTFFAIRYVAARRASEAL